jgi:hypothetical protein
MNFYLPQDWNQLNELMELGNEYINSLLINWSWKERNQRTVGLTLVQSFNISFSKSVIDKIDTFLAPHYGFSEEELDYIINYDIKYRMKPGADGSDGNE